MGAAEYPPCKESPCGSSLHLPCSLQPPRRGILRWRIVSGGAFSELSLGELEELPLAMLLALLQVRLLEVTETLEELEELWLELLEVELLEPLPAMPWKTLFLEAKVRARVRAREAKVAKASLEGREKGRARERVEREEKAGRLLV